MTPQNVYLAATLCLCLTAAGGAPDPLWTLAAVGGGLIVVAIPMAVASGSKLEDAVEAYNASLTPGETPKPRPRAAPQTELSVVATPAVVGARSASLGRSEGLPRTPSRLATSTAVVSEGEESSSH